MRAASAAAVGSGAWASLRSAALRLERVRPLWVIAVLAPAQWAIAVVVALHAPHNGWLFFSGGDATEYWSHEWALAHGLLPQTVLGYGVPVAFAWVPRLFGPTQMTGAAPIMVVQVLVLGTAALASVYGIASRIAGRLFALWSSALWVLAPVLAIPLWRSDFHYRWDGLFLPQALGIVNLGDYPSMVVILAGSYFVFRALDERRGNDALIAGLLMGLAVGVKPANALILPVPALAFVLARRWRELPLYAVALAPALLTLAVWKERGLGHIPLLAPAAVHEAAGTVASLPNPGRYLHFSGSRFGDNLAQVREFFWSRLLLEYLGAAGAFAALRRAPVKGVYLIAWFAAIFVVKGGSDVADVRTTSFFRVTMPGYPAYLLLAACVVLLVPGWGRRRAEPVARSTRPAPTRGLVLAVVLLAALPLAAVAAARPAPKERLARDLDTVTESPISSSLAITTERIADGVRLRWSGPDTNGSKVFYVVYRIPGGDGCAYYEAGGAAECVLAMQFLGRTGIRHLDDTPLPGRYTYRVALTASWDRNVDNGDVILLSPPATFAVRCTTEKCRRDAAKLGRS